MILKEKLLSDMKGAMKSKDSIRLNTIRIVKSEIKNQEISLRRELEDEEIITGPEVDNWLRISPTTRWRWTKLGRLPTPFRLHPHGQNLYRKREIKALIDAAPAVEIYRNRGDLSNKKQSRDV